MLPGQKMKLPVADFECLSAAMNTWLAIGQINGNLEKKKLNRKC
jgi:hypothetical protein